MPLANEIERLCALGCNVTITGNAYLTDAITKFATISHRSGGMLTIKGAALLLSSTREKIGAAGKNNVTFDFT